MMVDHLGGGGHDDGSKGDCVTKGRWQWLGGSGGGLGGRADHKDGEAVARSSGWRKARQSNLTT